MLLEDGQKEENMDDDLDTDDLDTEMKIFDSLADLIPTLGNIL